MTHTTQNRAICTNRALRNGALYSLSVEAALERSDRQAGHEYVPMDVFVDSATMREHFQVLSLRAR